MARKKYCPVCYTELEVIDVAPCDDCGWDENEIQHFDEKKHVYAEFKVYGASLILCSFCDVDFSSYDPEFWGFPRNKRLGYGSEGFQKLCEMPVASLSVKKGEFCPKCRARLTYLRALAEVRKKNVKNRP